MVEQVVGVTQVGAGRTAGALTPPSNKLICLIQCKICTRILNIDMLVIGAKSKFVLKDKSREKKTIISKVQNIAVQDHWNNLSDDLNSNV